MIFQKFLIEVLLLKKQLKHMTTIMIHMTITMKITTDAKTSIRIWIALHYFNSMLFIRTLFDLKVLHAFIFNWMNEYKTNWKTPPLIKSRYFLPNHNILIRLNHFNQLLTSFKHLLFLLQRNSSNTSVDWHMLLVVLVLLLHVSDESVDRTNTKPANPYRCKTILGKNNFSLIYKGYFS